MSITAWLRHISAHSLQKAKRDPAVFEQVIMELGSADSDAPLISNFSELTPNKIDVLREITSEMHLALDHWSIYDIEVLEDLKRIVPETYDRLKPELYSIVTDEKNCLYLDLNQSWDQISYLFRGGITMDPSTFISKVENKYRINLFSGKSFDPSDTYFPIRYQEVEEVLEMAESFSKIDEAEIRQRFEEALQIQAPVYKYGWAEKSYPILLEYCRKVQTFYQTAAIRGFGIVNAIF